jgi:hypothetical protein
MGSPGDPGLGQQGLNPSLADCFQLGDVLAIDMEFLGDGERRIIGHGLHPTLLVIK